VRSAARAVVPEAVDKQLHPAQPPAGAGNGSDNGSNGGSPGGGGGGSSTTPSTPPPTSPSTGASAPASRPSSRPTTPRAAASRVPTSQRLEVRDAVGGAASSAAYQVPDQRILDLTDIFVQNPQGDAGTLVISAQGRTLLLLALENFRDDPYYFTTPIVVPSGETVKMTVTCRQVGAPVAAPAPTSCVESMLLSGSLRPAPRPQTLR